MYVRKPQSWRKHGDFILLDVLCLQIAFVLAYMVRHGFIIPYSNPDYRNLAIVYTLVDITILIANRTMKNVLKRDFHKEIKKTIKHVLLVTLIISLYMFSVRTPGRR